MATRVIDLSHWNTVPESLRPAAEAGVWGVIHKLTEGISSVDETVVARQFLARDAGMLFGLYHFLRPGSMQDQVDHFLYTAESLGLVDSMTLFAADHEDPNVSIDDLAEFLARLEAQSGRSAVIYSGHVLKEQLGGKARLDLSARRLWLAQYSSAPTIPPGWPSYWLWQFTDQGSVPGVIPPTDCNAYAATRTALEAEWPGIGLMPPVTPQVIVRVIAPPGVVVIVEEG